jgi:acetyl esterase/lipase
MKFFIQLILILLFINGLKTSTYSQQVQYETISNINYYSNEINHLDSYIKERCVLDVYYPKNIKGFPTIVWFHGGGLTGGNKEIPKQLKEKGFCVVGVEYRLSPKVKAPAYIQDAAAAVKWAFDNITKFGGDTSLIFVSGFSAGGYLTLMVGLDKSYLSKYNIDANRIAGLIALSGQTITHFTVRSERGIPDVQPLIDSLAPLYHIRKDAPPLVLITGDRELELLGRYEENAYLMRMMRIIGHKDTRLYELEGYDHGEMVNPAFPLMIKEIQRIIENKKQSSKN